MKVGIVTQPLYANYGGILQNYALQQVLKKMGHEPITLDYMPSLPLGRYLLYAGKGLLYGLSPSKRHPIKPYKHFLQRPAIIDSFVRNNINLTKTISDYNRHILDKNGIEALIVGSDQVWRYSYNSHYLKDMYLDFAKGYQCRKIAYGASFGVEEWDYPPQDYIIAKELIKKFDAVYVRENSAVKICRDYLGVNATTVLDPTLLLSAFDYQELCKEAIVESESYIAAYVLDMNDEKKTYIQSFAKAKGLIVKQITVSDDAVSVRDWLNTIRHSVFVITDSYHGTLFSIIFRKPFQTIINKERGADRFITILNQLGLQDRLLYNVPNIIDVSDYINYDIVYDKLNVLSQASITKLTNNLL